jgi:hypothetical protein
MATIKWQKFIFADATYHVNFSCPLCTFLLCATMHAEYLQRMIHTRALDCPASGRSVFSAYDVYALDIQRKQTKRVPFSCGQNGTLRPQK